MSILILWVFFALLVGAISSSRYTGFWGGFAISLILSPIIGLIATLISNKKPPTVFVQQQPAPKPQHTNGTADQLAKFKQLLDNGTISEEEFNEQKRRLLA